jgi:hypothetical protein
MDRIERTEIFGRHVLSATVTAASVGSGTRWEVRVTAVELGGGCDAPMMRFPIAQSNQDEPLSAVDAALQDARARLSAAAQKP